MNLCALVAGGIVAVIGIVVLAMGFVVPGMVDDVVESALEDNTYLTRDSEAFENQIEPPKRGLASVRASAVADLDLDADENEDGGLNYIMHISNITNPEAALYDGARPEQSDVAYAFRKYTKYENATFSDSEESLTWDSQAEYIYVDDPARLDTEVLVIPNVGFAGFGALLPTLVGAARGVDALRVQAVSLRGNDPIQIDDIAIPIFVSQFLRDGLAPLVGLLKASTLPAVIPLRLAQFRAANSTSLGDQAEAQVGGTVPPGYTVDSALALTPALPGGTRVTAGVYMDLMNSSSTSGVALISAAGLPKWIGVTLLFAAVDTSDATEVQAAMASDTFLALTQEFVTAYIGLDASYSNPQVAAGHVLQVVIMMGGLIGPDTASAGQVVPQTFSTYLTLQGEASVSIPATTDLGMAAAQFGSNTITGSLAHAAGQLPGTITLPMAAGSAATDANTCLNGPASLFASINDPNTLNSFPEFSCLANAPPTIYSQRAHPSSNGLVFAGSKLPGATAMALLGQFSSSPSLFNEAGALLGSALPDFGAGSEAVWRFRAVYLKQIATDAATMAVINAQVARQSAYIAALGSGGDVAATLGAKVTGYATSLAADAAIHAACGQAVRDDVSSSIPVMDCFQVHDVFHWLAHSSNALVYFPRLVETYYGTENTPATTPGRSSGNLGTGPYIKATPRMLLLNGFRESILTSLGFGSVPPLVSNSTDGTRETVGTGTGGRDTFWEIQAVEGRTELEDWQGTVADPSPVEGSYDGLRFPYGEDLLDSEPGDLPLRYKVWVAQAERFVWLYKAVDEDTGEPMGAIKGPHGKLENIQRYSIHTEAVTTAAYGDDGGVPFTRYANDNLFNSPKCMVSVRHHPEYVSAQQLVSAIGGEADSTTEFDLFLTQPSGLACNETVRALSSIYAQAPTQAVHGSLIDVDPVSGRAVNAVRRLAGVLRLRPFGMYPRLAEGTGGEEVYVQIQWIEESGQATPGQEGDLQDTYEQGRTTKFALFVGLVAGGGVLFLIGVAVILICGGLCGGSAEGGKAVAPKQYDAQAQAA